MPELIVDVPSRGRPGNIRRLIAAFAETCTADTGLHVIVDHDDPTVGEYRSIPDASFYLLTVQHRRGLGPISNAAGIVDAEHARVIGNMGDDHLPRTVGWDSRIIETLIRPGVAYGDDLLQGERLPTAAFVTSDLIRCLGFICPPPLNHMYCDDFWKHLGTATSLHYLPDVIIEHLHPHAGKAETDDGYLSVNSDEAVERDRFAYMTYLDSGWPADHARLKAAGLA